MIEFSNGQNSSITKQFETTNSTTNQTIDKEKKMNKQFQKHKALWNINNRPRCKEVIDPVRNQTKFQQGDACYKYTPERQKEVDTIYEKEMCICDALCQKVKNVTLTVKHCI